MSAAVKKAKHKWYRFRSAVTGRFTSKADAKAAPDTTVRERADKEPIQEEQP